MIYYIAFILKEDAKIGLSEEKTALYKMSAYNPLI